MKEKSVSETRYLDFGPLDIENYEEFLVKSKENFSQNWVEPFTYKESSLTDFDLVKRLGSGSFGNVILIKRKSTSEYYALKAIEKSQIIKHKQLENVRNEKLVLQCLNYPFAVYLVFYFKDNNYVYFVMPFIDGGELFTYLRKFGKFDEVQARFYASQVVLALEYLHYLDLVYRDLKPENILMDHTGYLKLTDFGICKRMTKNRTYTLCGTPEYLAPEVILNKGYGKSVDWWALGVLMYELVAGISPFYSENPMKMYTKIVRNRYKIPKPFSPELKHLIRNILQGDLSKRFGNLKTGVDDIKDDKWFRQINWLAIVNRRVAPPYIPKCKEPDDITDGHLRHTYWDGILKKAKENQHPEEFADF